MGLEKTTRLLGVAILLSGAALAWGQSGAARVAVNEPQATRVDIDDRDGVEAMRSRIFAFVEGLTDYTAEVRVGDSDLEAILDHYAALDEMDDGEDTGGVVERAYRDGRYDFDVIVRDPTYVSWARSRDLEPEGFFRGLLRLEALRMREEGLAGLERAQQEMPAQRAQLESMKESMGEEGYDQALAALEAAAEMVEDTRVLMARLPQPSPDEAALLDANRQRIRAVLGRADVE